MNLITSLKNGPNSNPNHSSDPNTPWSLTRLYRQEEVDPKIENSPTKR